MGRCKVCLRAFHPHECHRIYVWRNDTLPEDVCSKRCWLKGDEARLIATLVETTVGEVRITRLAALRRLLDLDTEKVQYVMSSPPITVADD